MLYFPALGRGARSSTAERLTVAQEVAGSKPVGHPSILLAREVFEQPRIIFEQRCDEVYPIAPLFFLASQSMALLLAWLTLPFAAPLADGVMKLD